jgi:hypothetical protein
MRNTIILITMLSFVLGCDSPSQDTGGRPPVKNSTPPVAEKRNVAQWQISPDKTLSFRISTEKQKYRPSETVTVRAELKNNSDFDITVRPIQFAFGNIGDAIQIIGPQKVRYRGPFKNMPSPKKVVLAAGEVVTAEAAIDERYEGFGVAGKYRISLGSFDGSTSSVSIEIADQEQENTSVMERKK